MWQPDFYYKKPFYRRGWFLFLLATFFLFLLAGGIAAAWLFSTYSKRAAQFDLSKLNQMEAASTIYDRRGQLIGKLFIQNREPLPLTAISQKMMDALVSAEDARFYEHSGVDFFGIARALVTNWKSRHIRQGASTITQQLARNTFGIFERTYDRKILEIFLSLEIERHYSKRDILGLYLNRVYFGKGFYGVGAAAHGYFGKSLANLDVAECATLAGLLKSPNNLSPWSNRKACIEQRNYVLDRMLELKHIDQATHDRAVKEELIVKDPKTIHADSYALDYVRQQVEALVGKDSVVSDGYKIYTTLDNRLQRAAEESLARHLRDVEARPQFLNQPNPPQTMAQFHEQMRSWLAAQNDEDSKSSNPPKPAYLQGAFVVIDNETGGVLALAGGRDFKDSQYDRALSALRPAGTAFLPFVYAAGFEKGLFPGMLVEDTALDNRQVMIGGMTGILGEWGAERADNRYEGAMPASYALVKSKDAATVRFGMATGSDAQPVIDLAKRAGMTRTDKNGKVTNLRPYPSTFLGTGEVSLMEMTLAYSMFANSGAMPEKPLILSKVEDQNGAVVYSASPRLKQVLSASAAYEVNQSLADSLDWGTAYQAFSQDGLRRFPLGGKTGTAYNFTDLWFLGYSSKITCGVWVGFDKPRQPIYYGAFSNDIAMPIWIDIMNASFDRYPPKHFQQPPGLKNYEVNLATGFVVTPETAQPAVGQLQTYFQLATAEQVKNAGKDISLVKEKKTSTAKVWPKAQLAADVSAVQSVQVQRNPAAGNDPFQVSAANHQVQSGTATALPAAKSNEPEVRRAQAVSVPDQTTTTSTSSIPIAPPPPLKFE